MGLPPSAKDPSELVSGDVVVRNGRGHFFHPLGEPARLYGDLMQVVGADFARGDVTPVVDVGQTCLPDSLARDRKRYRKSNLGRNARSS